MKKRNLLLAVMAALTLSGCMLNQTEEKVYKSAEELPDDPVERYKAVASLCKFNGVESDVCKDNQIDVSLWHDHIIDSKLCPNIEAHTVIFRTRNHKTGKFGYVKKMRLSNELKKNLLQISKEGCNLYHLKNDCANVAHLLPEHRIDNWIFFDNNIQENFKDKYEIILNLSKSCELGNVEDCGRVIYFVDDQVKGKRSKTDEILITDWLLPLFYSSQNNFIRLYQSDSRALRYQKFENATWSGRYDEAASLAYSYCFMNDDVNYCDLALDGYNSLGRFYLYRRFMYNDFTGVNSYIQSTNVKDTMEFNYDLLKNVYLALSEKEKEMMTKNSSYLRDKFYNSYGVSD